MLTSIINKKLSSRINKYLVIQRIPTGNKEYVVAEGLFFEIIKFALRQIEFDEKWYLEQYKDVAAAISAGAFSTAREHFVEHGYFEGRLPYRIHVDEKFYLEKYPDVVAAIKNGIHKNATEHFYVYGAQEGRLPHKGFTLFPVDKSSSLTN